jgi:hypothetical protein
MPNLHITLPTEKTIEIAPDDYSKDKIERNQHLKLQTEDGWRLPDIEELQLMYSILHTEGKGDFENDWYWSTSCFEVSWDYSVDIGVNFADGSLNASSLENGHGSLTHAIGEARVRLVREKNS